MKTVARSLLALLAAAGASLAFAPAHADSTTPGSQEFTLASPSVSVTNLAFTGTSSVASGSVTLTVLRFTADQLDAAEATLTEPCLPQHFNVVETVGASGTASFAGPVTVLATSLSYTPEGGTTVTYDASSLPPAGILIVSGSLPSAHIIATSLTAASMRARASLNVSAC